MLEKSNEGNQE